MAIVKAILLIGLIGLTTGGPATARAQSGEPLAGRWQVGFTFVSLADSNRRLASGAVRPLDIGVWYPTKAAGPDPITYRDYFLVANRPDELPGLTRFLVSHGAQEPDVLAWLDAPMQATRDAPPAGERFPLVLLAQGNGQTIADQAPLAEYLASRGYVVATTPSPMRVTGPLTDEGQVGARADEQATDLELAADILVNLREDIAGGQFGIVGHSFGARAGLLLMMRGPRLAALVSLDGGIGTATGRYAMERLPGYRIDAARSPILHFYEDLSDYMTPDFSLLRSLTRSKRWIRLVPLPHHLFTSLGAATIEHPRLRAAVAATDSTPDVYSAVLRETVAFLDAFLKRDAAALSWLEGAASRPPLGRLEQLP